MNITNYFNHRHKKFSYDVYFNMDRAGFDVLSEREVDVIGEGENARWEKSKEVVQALIDFYGKAFENSEYVFYRRAGAFGVPFITIFVKHNNGSTKQ